MMRMELQSHKLAVWLPKTLGGVFITSALLKFYALQSFQGEVRLYLEAYFPSVFIGNEQLIAFLTCLIEFIMGLCAVVGCMKRIICINYVAILTFFVWLTGLNLFYPSLMGSVESCGCFGELIHFTPMMSFIKSILLWILSIIWLYFEYSKNNI